METRLGKKAELKKGIKIFIGALVAIAIIATLGVLWSSNTSTELRSCGQTICAEFNQEYRGWVQDKLECTYNYQAFGYPEVEEIFSFTINQSMIDNLCNGDTNESAQQ